MSLILFFLFIGIFILIIASTVVISVIRGILSFFGITKSGGKGFSGSYRSTGAYGNQNRQNGTYNTNDSRAGDDASGRNSSASGWHYSPEAEYKRRKRKKIIDESEGEYVDFEEVK